MLTRLRSRFGRLAPRWDGPPRRFAAFVLVATVACGFLAEDALASGPLASGPLASELAACDAAAVAPEPWNACKCYGTLASTSGRGGEVRKHLESKVAAGGASPCQHLYLGFLTYPDSLEHYSAAADGFAERRQPLGEYWAHLSLATLFEAEPARALEQAEAALAAAKRAPEPPDLGRAELLRLRAGLHLGHDLYDLERRLFRVVERARVSRDADLERRALFTLGTVRYELARYREALETYRDVAELNREAGNGFAEASARTGLAQAHMLTAPRPGLRSESLELWRRALETSLAAGAKRSEAKARQELGKLLGGAEGRRELEASVALAGDLDRPLLAESLGSLAVAVAEEEPERARRLLEEAIEALDPSSLDTWDSYGWSQRLRVRWATAPPEEAHRDSLATLDLIERLRDLQRAEGGRAEQFASRIDAYRWLGGRLLAEATGNPAAVTAAGGPSPEGAPELQPGSAGWPHLERAFTVVERMRARVLLEALDGADDHGGLAGPDREEHRRVLEAMVRINRLLLTPGTPKEERRRGIERLSELEQREDELLYGAGGPSPERGRPADGFAALLDVQGNLAEDEALLSFQVGDWQDLYGRFGGGGWLVLVTRSGVTLHPLPGAARLRPAVALLLDLLSSGGEGASPSKALHDWLLADALGQLPESVEHLVLVPDGVLHRLPFAALADATGSMLVDRYRLSVVPSATLWRRWRSEAAAATAEAALVLADPRLASHGSARASEGAGVGVQRAWASADPMDLGPLPAARREAAAIRRQLGPGTRLLAGADASESALASALAPPSAGEPTPFGVVHFAAHAVVDDLRPRRSAVMLAAEGSGDGLLQPREIVRLPIDGRLVVLSTCHSAGGRVLEGEGVLSLARAFFQAGAPAVVGSLWRLGDEEASALFDLFYRRLGEGASVAEALASAQRQRRLAGAPAAAWAGVVPLGDAARVPFPEGAVPGRPPVDPRTLGGFVALALSLILLLWARRSA